MTLTLSVQELQQLAIVLKLLVTPFSAESIDGWRSTVNAHLKQLLGADSAGFLLPVVEGPAFYSEEHDPAELAKYPYLNPPPLSDGTSIWQRATELRVATMATAYGAESARYFESSYYREYAAPNGACATLAAIMPLGGHDPRSIASLQLWRDRQNRRFSERELHVMSLLYPSLTAGVELLLHSPRQRMVLTSTLDSLGQAAIVYDRRGRVLHETHAISVLLATDPQAADLRVALARAAASLVAVARSSRADEGTLRATPVSDVRTVLAAYRIRICLHADAGVGGETLIFASIERTTPALPSTDTLRREFRLTPAEERVALLLARGRSNRQIASVLSISEATARRHTERVLHKLGVASRAEVGPRLAERA